MSTEIEDVDIPASNELNKSSEEKSPDQTVGKPRVAKKVPHYLRASTTSCHEACKHGTTHKFRDKQTLPIRRRMSAPLDGKKTVDIQIYVDKKVQKAVQPDERELLSAIEAVPANNKPRRNLVPSRIPPIHVSPRLVQQETRSFTKSPSSDAPELIKKVVQSSRKSSMSDTLKILKPKYASAAKNNVSLKRTPLYPKEANASEVSLKQNVRGEKPSSLSNTMKISKPVVAPVAKRSFSSKIGIASHGSNGSPLKSDGSIASHGSNGSPLKSDGRGSLDSTRLSSKLTSKNKVGDNPRTSRVSVVKTVASSAAMSVRGTSKVEVKKLSLPTTAGKSLKDQNRRSQAFVGNQILVNKAEPKKPAGEKVVEKTLHMIDVKEDYSSTAPNSALLAQPPSPLSPESLNSSTRTYSPSCTSNEVDDQYELDSEYADSDAEGSISNYNSSGESKATDSLKEGKGRNHGSEVRDPASLKLKFRNGKVVEHQSETNSMRRLRFRKGRTLDDNEDTNGGAQQKRYRERAAGSNKKEQAETSLVKVVLKHQEMETKKDEQVSLNNVIQENVSKLVQKRKSKVKALVGAFESVISLQERKPSAADR